MGAGAAAARAVRGGDDWASFTKLTGAIVCRSVVLVGLSAFISLFVRERTGGVAGPFIGALADATSLRIALTPLIALPALGWLLLRTLDEPAMPEAAPRRPTAVPSA